MGANCSVQPFPDANLSQFVIDNIGPRCLEDAFAISTTVIYSFLFLLGVFGNICTCIVIWKHKQMHNATNYYLFSLSVSDLLCIVLGLPLELYSSQTVLYPYSLPLFVCKVRGFVSESTSYASVMTIFAFSVERWIAICYPFKIQTFSRTSRVFKILISIWILAFAAASPLPYYLTIYRMQAEPSYNDSHHFLFPNRDIPGTEICSMKIDSRFAQVVLIHTIFWTFFVTPFLIMLMLFVHIWLVMRRTERHGVLYGLSLLKIGFGNKDANNSQYRTRRAVTRMLFVVVGVFFLCWLPFHIQRLMILHVNMNQSGVITSFFNFVYFLSGYFYYANSAINPILYNAFNLKFRRAFVATIFCNVSISDFSGYSSLRLSKKKANKRDSPAGEGAVTPTHKDDSRKASLLKFNLMPYSKSNVPKNNSHVDRVGKSSSPNISTLTTNFGARFRATSFTNLSIRSFRANTRRVSHESSASSLSAGSDRPNDAGDGIAEDCESPTAGLIAKIPENGANTQISPHSETELATISPMPDSDAMLLPWPSSMTYSASKVTI